MEQDDHVDEEMLADVLMLMEDEAADGILRACDLFRASVPDRLDDIGAALAEERFVDAGRASHSLRGSAGAFGAKRLSALGLRLEDLCRESDAGAAAEILGEMRTEFVVFRDILDARLQQFR
jgi:HPt (histidine-containing phosphotransfer) domain-containing protein